MVKFDKAEVSFFLSRSYATLHKTFQIFKLQMKLTEASWRIVLKTKVMTIFTYLFIVRKGTKLKFSELQSLEQLT